MKTYTKRELEKLPLRKLQLLDLELRVDVRQSTRECENLEVKLRQERGHKADLNRLLKRAANELYERWREERVRSRQ